MCGYTVREIPTDANATFNLELLQGAVGPHTAGLMLTTRSHARRVQKGHPARCRRRCTTPAACCITTARTTERILCKGEAGDMVSIVIHMNLHKLLHAARRRAARAAAPGGVNERFVAVPSRYRIGGTQQGRQLFPAHRKEKPQTIGPPVCSISVTPGVLLRAYIYAATCLGREGNAACRRVLHAQRQLHAGGIEETAVSTWPSQSDRAPTTRVHCHAQEAEKMKPASALWTSPSACSNKGYHAPTTYFPLLVPECFLIEPTEDLRPRKNSMVFNTSDGSDRARGAQHAGRGEGRSAHPAGQTPRRCQGGARTRSHLEASDIA